MVVFLVADFLPYIFAQFTFSKRTTLEAWNENAIQKKDRTKQIRGTCMLRKAPAPVPINPCWL